MIVLFNAYFEKFNGVFVEDLFLIIFIGEKGADKFDILFYGSKRPIRTVK